MLSWTFYRHHDVVGETWQSRDPNRCYFHLYDGVVYAVRRLYHDMNQILTAQMKYALLLGVGAICLGSLYLCDAIAGKTMISRHEAGACGLSSPFLPFV